VTFLLDTQVWLWLQANPHRIPDNVRGRLADPATRLLLSAVSAWEIAVKYALGKLPLPEPPQTYVPSRMRYDSVDGFPVSHTHALHVASLPPHHGDPFDRMLVAQAQLENVTLVTADPQITKYEVDILWAHS